MLLKAPNLPARIDLLDCTAEAIRDAWAASCVSLEKIDLTGARASNIGLDQVRFTSAVLHAAEFPRARLWDVELSKCDCAGIALTSGALHRVTFVGCRLSGANFSQSVFEHVRLENCKLEQTNFRGC